MSRRIMGKASFIELKDSEGRIQVYISRDDLCPGEDKELYNTVFKKLLDIGDFIGIRGFVFRTQMGEITVHAQELTVLAKSIRPLPIVKVKDGVAYDAFEDPELRYRQRYVDLVVNEGVKDIFIKRNKVYTSMREYFNSRGYHGSRNTHSAIDTRRCGRPSVHHPPQRTRHTSISAYRRRIISETSDCRRLRRSVRIFQKLPQRRHGQHAQSGVHLHGNLCLLQGLQLDDGLHRENA